MEEKELTMESSEINRLVKSRSTRRFVEYVLPHLSDPQYTQYLPTRDPAPEKKPRSSQKNLYRRISEASREYTNLDDNQKKRPDAIYGLLSKHGFFPEDIPKASLLFQKTRIRIQPSYESYLEQVEISRHTALVEKGIFKKVKSRSFKKTVYEALAMDIFHAILEGYRQTVSSTIIAPESRVIDYNFSSFSGGLYMGYIKGKGLNKVLTKSDDEDLIALHLGVLNAIKKYEKILHGDYALRHLLWFNNKERGLGVIDFEKTRRGSSDEVEHENSRIFDNLILPRCSQKNRRKIIASYHEGYDSVSGLDVYPEILSATVAKFTDKMGISELDVDFEKGEIINLPVIG